MACPSLWDVLKTVGSAAVGITAWLVFGAPVLVGVAVGGSIYAVVDGIQARIERNRDRAHREELACAISRLDGLIIESSLRQAEALQEIVDIKRAIQKLDVSDAAKLAMIQELSTSLDGVRVEQQRFREAVANVQQAAPERQAGAGVVDRVVAPPARIAFNAGGANAENLYPKHVGKPLRM